MIIVEAKDWNKLVTTLRDFGESLKDLEMEIEFKAEAGHSAYQEFGTYKMEAQPYFYENFDKLGQKIEQIFSSPDPTPQKIESAANDTLHDMKDDAPVDTGELRSKITMQKR